MGSQSGSNRRTSEEREEEGEQRERPSFSRKRRGKKIREIEGPSLSIFVESPLEKKKQYRDDDDEKRVWKRVWRECRKNKTDTCQAKDSLQPEESEGQVFFSLTPGKYCNCQYKFLLIYRIDRKDILQVQVPNNHPYHIRDDRLNSFFLLYQKLNNKE